MLSIVIPLLNEHETLRPLHAALTTVLNELDQPYELVFVDDGSTDTSWQIIAQLAHDDPRVQGIRFRRNFGKAAALAAGFDAAQFATVITMDADLQDDPQEIPRFLNKLAEGYDVVSGWKRVRHDPWHKTIPSWFFNRLVSWLTGVNLHDHNCGFKAYRREIFDEVKLYGERHRFVPVLAAARGWRVTEIEVLHHPRQHGQSKYGLSRLPKGFLDLFSIFFLTSFAQRPLHLIGSMGLFSFLLGSVGLLVLSTLWVTTRVWGDQPLHLHSTAIFYYCITAILLGGQFLVAGLLAEQITSVTRNPTSTASVKERTEPHRRLTGEQD